MSLIARVGPAHARIAIVVLAMLTPVPAAAAGSCTDYDGVTDDLLTAGLGASGLAVGAPPLPAMPTAAQLRRNAISVNYRALVDMTAAGGYGVFYGPTIANTGGAFNVASDGRIAGRECLVFSGSPSARRNVTMMVQVPDSFDAENPCIVTAASSGSRGIYGAIATSGEWGLKQGCAVAYTDKGTGTGAQNLATNSISLINGLREDAYAAGKTSNFTAPVPFAARRAYNLETPNRFAFKHAHSKLNPEASWGQNVLDAIAYAFTVLNDPALGFGRTFTPDNTIVIASSVSNGAGAALKALERDRRGLIDGFAGSEPQINPNMQQPLTIRFGGVDSTDVGKPLYDYYTTFNLYQGCANRAAANATAPFNITDATLGQNMCASLREKGLITGDTLEAQAVDAQARINAQGILEEQNAAAPSFWFFQGHQAIGVTYANAYARSGVEDRLCGYSLGATTAVAGTTGGDPIALPDASEQGLFSNSNGIPPTTGINLINDRSVGGSRNSLVSTSASTGRQDQNLDGALCLRDLWEGTNAVTGARLPRAEATASSRLRAGVRQILASGNLRGKPAIIVTGRADQVVPPNHGSRAYYGLNQQVEGGDSGLRYYEVTNAQHLDSFIGALAGYNVLYVPLHVYFVEGLNRLYAHLTTGAALPASQVVRTVPRGAGAPALTPANIPPIADAPAADALITFAGNVLTIPE